MLLLNLANEKYLKICVSGQCFSQKLKDFSQSIRADGPHANDVVDWYVGERVGEAGNDQVLSYLRNGLQIIPKCRQGRGRAGNGSPHRLIVISNGLPVPGDVGVTQDLVVDHVEDNLELEERMASSVKVMCKAILGHSLAGEAAEGVEFW